MAITTLPLSFTLTLVGRDQVARASQRVQAVDESGAGLGWRLTISATQFATDGPTPRTLPETALAIGQGSGASFSGPTVVSDSIGTGEVAPQNTTAVSSQFVVPSAPIGGSAPAPATFFNAAAETGKGSFEIEVPYSLFVPGNAYAGTYSATITITQLVGP